MPVDKKNIITAAWTVFLLPLVLSVPSNAAADSFSVVDEQKIHLFSEALDLVVSSDGRWTFVLTKNGMVSIYDVSGRLVQSIKAGTDYRSIEYNRTGNRIILSGPDTKEVKILALSMIYKLDYEGSPARGPSDAPVTIAAFDDFQ